MKSVLSLLFALFVSAAVSQDPYASCGVFDTGNFKLYDVTAYTMNTSDSLGIISGNICVDQERKCSYSTNLPCSVCQFVSPDSIYEHSYCIGYNNVDKIFTHLPDTLPNNNGFRVTLKGDSTFCPQNLQRQTIIDVLCDQPATKLEFVREEPICTYNIILYQKGNCQVGINSFTPSFTLSSLTPNSIEVLINDQYPFMFWTYSVLVNDQIAYTGIDRRVKIENLDAGTTYNVKVKTDPGVDAVTRAYTPVSPASKIVTLPTNVGNFHNPIVSGTGAGIAYGIIIALCILAALVGGYKFYRSDFFHEKFGVGGGGSKSSKGFSLMDAEKSNAFE